MKTVKETVLGFPVVRSDRKTVGISVQAGGAVQIRAPKRMKLCDIETAVRLHADWLENAVSKMKTKQARPKCSAKEQELLRLRAKELLPKLTEAWSQRTGLVPTSVRITSARTRYGSCSSKNGICFSLFLMQSPPDAIEYVVVHELCHIRHHDHSREFWALVESYLPDYKERKKKLI